MITMLLRKFLIIAFLSFYSVANLYSASNKIISDTTAQKSGSKSETAFAAELVKINQSIVQKNFPAAEQALDQLIGTLKVKKISADRNKQLSKACSMYGNVLLMQAKFDLALKKYLLSLDYIGSAEAYANTAAGRNPQETRIALGMEKAKIYSNIGAVYSMLKNLSKGKEYFLKALEANPLDNLDRLKTLSNMAGLYAETGEDKQALHTFNTAISLSRKLKDLPMEAVLLTNVGNYHLKHKAWEKSILASRNSLAVRINLHQPLSVITLNNLGYALAQTGHYPEATSYYQQALPAATAMEQKQLLNNLYQAQKALGNIPSALKYLERYTKLTDSLNILNYNNKVASLTAAYEAVKKERTISGLQKSNALQRSELLQQRYLIMAALIILVLASVLIYIGVKNHNVKQDLEKSRIQRQLLLLQLNPHFIFNALQSIQQFIYNRDQEKSMEYLNSFSRLIRLILENSDRETITLAEEIELLEHYLHLKQLESGSSFTYEISVADEIETEMIEIPVMMLQPFVENAVMHGVKGREHGKILVSFNIVGNIIGVSIMDNGEGMNGAANHADNTLHRSMSMAIVKQRIAEMNKGKLIIELRQLAKNDNNKEYPGAFAGLEFRPRVPEYR
jgi:tetratricopeptide (TPR) repeat protein